MGSAKQAYIDAMTRMLKIMSIEQIRVKDICAETHTNRHTFYYYFNDKHELVSLVFKETIEGYIRSNQDILSKDVGIRILEKIKEDKIFYKNALLYRGDNALGGYILEYCYRLLTKMAYRNLSRIELTYEELAVLRYHTYGIVGLMYDWIDHDCTPSGEDLLDTMVKMIPPYPHAPDSARDAIEDGD